MPLSDAKIAEDRAIALLAELIEVSKGKQIQAHYEKMGSEEGSWLGPYEWQVKFHQAGDEFEERAIIAANQTGKTRTCAAEVAIHATGLYPPWWQGHRFKRANDWIVCGNTNEDVRNIQQKALVGTVSETRSPTGTGWIPADCIGLCGFRQCGIPNVLDTVKVKHVTGEWSILMFKSYEQGAVKYQGLELDGAWMDEEPPLHHDDIFSEVRTRLIKRNGLLLFSRTPLFGMSRIIRHFLEGGPGIWWIGATWDEAPHLAKETRERYSLTYQDYEVDARTKGVPMLGSGGVYPVPDEQIKCDPFPIPDHYRRIAGIDFGIDHPTAVAWLAYDADADIVYVTDCHKQRGETPSYHSQAIKSRGVWIPVSWPHDGMSRDKGSGIPLAQQYRSLGVNMLGEPASWSTDMQVSREAKPQSRETGNIEILDRMRSGRFKVFSHLSEWFQEKRLLHRKEGRIVAIDDDLESATRYAIMMLRCAVSDAEIEENHYRNTASVDMSYDPLSEYSTAGGY